MNHPLKFDPYAHARVFLIVWDGISDEHLSLLQRCYPSICFKNAKSLSQLQRILVTNIYRKNIFAILYAWILQQEPLYGFDTFIRWLDIPLQTYLWSPQLSTLVSQYKRAVYHMAEPLIHLPSISLPVWPTGISMASIIDHGWSTMITYRVFLILQKFWYTICPSRASDSQAALRRCTSDMGDGVPA